MSTYGPFTMMNLSMAISNSIPRFLRPKANSSRYAASDKLWRENLEVRTALGWALDDELGHTTRYEYHHGGALGANNQYIAGPGYHLVESLYGDTFRFNEVDSTWQIVE